MLRRASVVATEETSANGMAINANPRLARGADTDSKGSAGSGSGSDNKGSADTKGNSDTQGSADTKGSASAGDKPSKGPSQDKNEDDNIICKDLEVKNGDCKTKGKGKCRSETDDE